MTITMLYFGLEFSPAKCAYSTAGHGSHWRAFFVS